MFSALNLTCVYRKYLSVFIVKLVNIKLMKNILYCVLFLLFFSCKSHEGEKAESQEVISIDVDNTSLISEPALNNYTFVNLEFTDASALKDIGKVVCANNKLYVLSISDPTVFIFNRMGGFEKKLLMGQGPGEVVSVSDLTVYKDTLYVLDRYRNVKMYDLNGKYIRDKMTLDSPYFSVSLNDNGIYLFDPNINSKSDYNLCFVSNEGGREDFIKKETNFRDVAILFYNPFLKSEYLVWPLSNIIYKMSFDGNVSPIYEIDFNGKWISGQEYKSAVTNEDMCAGKLNQYVRWLKDFMPIKNGCFFGFKYKEKDYFTKYQNGKIELYSNLFGNLPEMHDGAVGCISDSLIYTYSIADLNEYAKNHANSIDVKVDSIYKLCENEDSNPVLIFTSIK